jgi:hypothetical protein
MKIGQNRKKWKDDPCEYNRGHLSKTDFFASLPNSYKKYLNMSKKVQFCPTINIDWLEFFGDGRIPKPRIKEKMKPEDFIHKLSDDTFLKYRGHGTSMYNSLFDVYVSGEEFATLKAHPRVCKGPLTEYTFSLEIKNHLLYANYWPEYLTEFIYLLDLKIENVTRCDIAIDGNPYAEQFLNTYFKQNAENKYINLLGKARFTPQGIHHKTMQARSFSVGSAHSDKIVSVYCKSDEIETSNKGYIQAFWKRSGMKLEEGQRVHRIEMRMRSKFIKSIVDFDFLKLTDCKYLASIFMTGCKGFFEFTWQDNPRLDRQTRIDLIPWEMLGAELLEKNKKPETSDRYKAKLSIHLFEKLLITGKIKNEKQAHSMRVQLIFLVNYYSLEKWYIKKLDEWTVNYENLRVPI